ncbi:hypothetical protein [Cohnella sp. GbtcB17]|uniref:hypothetical protein n=1 Tax=Cohnella sp. GbtcB17 TaxID=2824762 RepID=UPI001C3082F0|nr:hypothetical protein [Cohnella sp. GbtcB17]
MSEELLRQIAEKLGDVVGRLDRMEQKVDQIDNRLERVEQKVDQFEQKMDQMDLSLARVEQKVDRIDTKLDAAFEQVAKNTEHEVAFNDLASKVAEHTTDIRLLKKIVVAS